MTILMIIITSILMHSETRQHNINTHTSWGLVLPWAQEQEGWEVSLKEQLQEEEDAAGSLSPVEVVPLQSTLSNHSLSSSKYINSLL